MKISKGNRRVAWSLALVVVAVLSATAKGPELTSAWTPRQIQIDGKSYDWQGVAGTTVAEKGSMAVANDQRFMYVLFRTDDVRTVRMIRVSGLTIYVDPAGGRKKDFYVTFKGGPSREQMRTLRSGERRRGQEDGMRQGRDGMPPMDGPMGEMQRDSSPSLLCFVKDKIVEKPIPLNGSEGPAAAFDTSQGFFTYEFRIPLVADSVRYYGVGVTPGKPFSIGAVWGDMSKMLEQRPERQEGFGMGDSPGGMGGGPGGPGGMGDRPGGFEGPAGMRGDRPSKQEVWVKTSLAKAE